MALFILMLPPGLRSTWKALLELAYAQVKLEALDKAAGIYNTAIANTTNKVAISEIAFNIAGYYYNTRNKEQFKHWDDETRKWANADSKYLINMQKMEADLQALPRQ
jgi:hypothetical protein